MKRYIVGLICLLFIVLAFYLYRLTDVKHEPVSTTASETDFIEDELSEKENDLDQKMPIEKDEPHEPITLSFAGDVLLDLAVGNDIEAHGVSYPFQHVASLFTKADLAAVNLETSVSIRGTPADKQFTFRSRPETLQGVVKAGIDVVSLANNHTLDYGTEALFDTMKHLDTYKIGYTGAGKNEKEAFSAYYTTIKGKNIAILGLSRVLPEGSWFAKGAHPGIANAYHDEPMMSYVKEAVEKSDYTIVMIHWNRELQDYPEDYAKVMARQLIDAGVSAVIGSHSHSLMGIEYYKGSPIFYSLGNFVFTKSSVPKGNETMIVDVTLDHGTTSTQITPLKIIHHQPRPIDAAYNRELIQKLNRLSYNVVIDLKGNVSLKDS
jgi:poly-gamma-glutamate capsule biosynthesis protein CapA/YwtB (metallophosphatase superfamily)